MKELFATIATQMMVLTTLTTSPVTRLLMNLATPTQIQMTQTQQTMDPLEPHTTTPMTVTAQITTTSSLTTMTTTRSATRTTSPLVITIRDPCIQVTQAILS